MTFEAKNESLGILAILYHETRLHKYLFPREPKTGCVLLRPVTFDGLLRCMKELGMSIDMTVPVTGMLFRGMFFKPSLDTNALFIKTGSSALLDRPKLLLPGANPKKSRKSA